ncbi:MAG: hypothetical protein LBF78_02355 [Treponema sp.]|jgi:hypothetical protein|nr:hypothetical protein [Treponema sp.]
MKTLYCKGLLPLLLILQAACSFSVYDEYKAVLPEPPLSWLEILGEPHWRLEWVSREGTWKTREIAPASCGAGSLKAGPSFERISFPQEWTAPVLAWPYWPEKKIPAGLARPAGALFPWDVRTGRLELSWRAGVDAYLWQRLAAEAAAPGAPGTRPPWYFDWQRFREFMQGDTVQDAVKKDPWTADWKTIARKLAASGFNKNYFAPLNSGTATIRGPDTLWYGMSPFCGEVKTQDGFLSLPLGNGDETWFSTAGILRFSQETSLFISWED